MSPAFYYIFQAEDGESIVEYESNVFPPEEGKIMNLTNITSDYGFVEVLKVEQMPADDRVVVRVTVAPVRQ